MDMCNVGMSCSSLEVVNKMKAISLEVFKGIISFGGGENAAKRNSEVNFSNWRVVLTYVITPSFAEENYREDCSDNTTVSRLTVYYRANLIRSCVTLGIWLAKD